MRKIDARNAEIVACYREGYAIEEVAGAYGLSPATVKGIVAAARGRERYAAQRDKRERAEFRQRVRELSPTWRSLDDFGRSLRADQWDDPRDEVPSVYWQANDILMLWLDGRANETMTVLRLKRLTEVA